MKAVINPYNIRYLIVFAVIVCLLLTASPSRANQGSWPQTGRIVFEVLQGEGGMKLGESVHSWQHNGQRYNMTSTMETTGLAAMLKAFRYTQSSEGRIENRQLIPNVLTIDQPKEQEVARFDWDSGQVVITRKQRQRNFDVRIGDVDMLSIWHLVAANGGLMQSGNFQVVTNRAAYPVRFETHETSSIKLQAGQFEARHVRFVADSGSLRIDMWLSTAHGLVPVRVLMVDDKGQTLDQRAICLETR